MYFIIQDSIRIYTEYDRVILAGFGSVSSYKQVAERFPLVEEQEVCRPVTSRLDREKIESDIHTVIMYRLKALPSPKAFFTGDEAMRFAGEEPENNSTMLPWTEFYIPGYSESTNRDYILFVIGYSTKTNSEVNADEFSDLFGFCNKNGASIFYMAETGEPSVDIFPSESIYMITVTDIVGTNKDNTVVNKPGSDKNNDAVGEQKICFKLDMAGGLCSLMTSDGKTEAEEVYVCEGDAHILNFDGDFRYVFYYNEYIGYEYSKGESNPIPGYEFENETVFSLNDNLLQPTDK